MITPRGRWRRSPDRTLLAVLLLVLGVTAVLGYQAWDAARSHRRVTEATLRDYAGFAAWELRRRVESNANATLNMALMPGLLGPLDLGNARPVELTTFALATDNAFRACGCEPAASDYFRIDIDSGELQIEQAALGDGFQGWLTGEFLVTARAALDDPEMRAGFRVQIDETRAPSGATRRVFVTGTALPGRVLAAEAPVPFDSVRVVVYNAGQYGDRRIVQGFVVDVPEFVRTLVAEALSGPPLLPPTLAGPLQNDSTLSARVWLVGGDTVFRTADRSAPVSEVVDTFRLATGLVGASIAVRPEIAGRLIIGGLPRSRVPILLGSIGLTLVLLLIALVQLRRQHELYRLRGDFVSGVSHELRTPLAQIRLFSDLLASERLDDGQRRRSIRILTDEAKRLTYLVDNVLRFSRSERQTQRIAPSLVAVDQFLQQVIADFAPLAQARGARIELDSARPLRAWLDADAMRQVLLNLLDNAVKYGPREQVIIVRAMVESGRLRIEVDDEGPGIPPSERERIWEPYRRLPREMEGTTGGSGIGLAVVREIMTLHGGRSFVADGARAGSRFVLLLPHRESEPEIPAGAGAGAASPGEVGV